MPTLEKNKMMDLSQFSSETAEALSLTSLRVGLEEESKICLILFIYSIEGRRKGRKKERKEPPQITTAKIDHRQSRCRKPRDILFVVGGCGAIDLHLVWNHLSLEVQMLWRLQAVPAGTKFCKCVLILQLL